MGGSNTPLGWSKLAGSGWSGRWAYPWAVLGQAGCKNHSPQSQGCRLRSPGPRALEDHFRADLILYPALLCDFGP